MANPQQAPVITEIEGHRIFVTSKTLNGPEGNIDLMDIFNGLSEDDKNTLRNTLGVTGGFTEAQLLTLGFVRVVDGKIPVSFLPNASVLDLLNDRQDITYIPHVGQSLSNGNTPSAAITTVNPDPDIIAFAGGLKSVVGEFTGFIALVESNDSSPEGFSSGETGAAQNGIQLLAYAAANGGEANVEYMFQLCGRGSARLDQLLEGSTAGYFESFFLPPLQALGTLSASQNKTVEMPMVVFRQGEQSSPESFRVTWADQFRSYRDQMQSAGMTNLTRQQPLKVLCYQTSMKGSRDGGTILAQWDLFNSEDWMTISTPTYPIYALGGVTASVHPGSLGYAVFGAYEGRAGAKFLYEGSRPKPLYPTFAEAAGEIVTVTYDVPTPPIALDQTQVPAVQDYGFRVLDDTGDLAISNVRVVPPNKIAFDVDRAVGANGKIRFGMDYDFAGSIVNNGVATNIRDSDPETVTIGANIVPLYNWSLHGDMALAPDITPPFPGSNVWVTRTDSSEAYQDRRGASNLTELGSAPTFDADSMQITQATSLDTNIQTDGDTYSAWAVVYFDPTTHNSSSTSASILNTKNGTFTTPGNSLQLSRQDSGGNLLHKVALFTLNDSSGSQTNKLFISHDYTGFALVGFSVDATGDRRKVFISPLAAFTTDVLEQNNATGSHPVTNNLQIGRGDYAHGATGTLGSDIALVGYSPSYLSATDIDSVIADAENRLGITL